MAFLDKIFGSFSDKELKKIRPIADKVLALEDHYKALSDAELQAVTPALKERLAAGETLDDILPDAFAACREATVCWGCATSRFRSSAALCCTAARSPR